MIYYLQVINDGLSILLEDDKSYHYFNIGDIIKIKFTSNLSTLYFGDRTFNYDGKYGVWFTINQQKQSISDCINSNLIVDITKQIERDEKINKILSDESDT